MKEHVPFDAYGLLRRIVGRGPQRVRNRVFEDRPARYLISRKLARPAGPQNDQLENTEQGALVGLIDHTP